MEHFQTEEQKKQESKTQTAAIMLAIEIASNFKLYSYRIINTGDYVSRTKELIHQFNEASASLDASNVGGKEKQTPPHSNLKKV